MVSLAVGTGGYVVIVVVLLVVFALAYGLFTRRGSGISAHPHRDQRAPGGEEAIDEESSDEPVSPTLDDRGTR